MFIENIIKKPLSGRNNLFYPEYKNNRIFISGLQMIYKINLK